MRHYDVSPDYILGGYIPSWRIDSNTNPEEIPVNQLTHLFYAFAHVDPDGNVSLYADGLNGDTDYVKQQGIGGAFFWEITGDLPITHPDSLISAAATNLGI
jgi:GH18 family chitinase